ncbi:hypothetical protein ABWJ92_37945 [Streptomyces sp. NPDC000609]|uniref:hypothetical protein n=1 Tax=Streptomyces sp. NPDC000609 TaxID=3160957 RepID=UPI003396ECD2
MPSIDCRRAGLTAAPPSPLAHCPAVSDAQPRTLLQDAAHGGRFEMSRQAHDSLGRARAAITAILDRTERITKQNLDTIRLDHLAETHHHTTPEADNPTHQADRKS